LLIVLEPVQKDERHDRRDRGEVTLAGSTWLSTVRTES